MRRVLIFIPFAVVLTACGQPASVGGADAKKTADALTGNDKGAAVNNPQCELFTQAEIAAYIGEPVSPGQNTAVGTGCQWGAADGSGDVIVAVVPSRYHEPPKLATGYKALADVGAAGFVAPELDGWASGAIAGEEAIKVSVAGSGASEATAIALLKETLKRHAPERGKPAHPSDVF